MYRANMEILLRTIIFPFTSLECYKEDYIKTLAEAKDYKEYKRTYDNGFKYTLYNSLNRKYFLHNLDYVDMIIEKYYSYIHIKGKKSYEIFFNILSNCAKSFVCHRNGRLALKYWESQNDETFIGPYKGINKIALWNTLNRMMCTDIIIINYLLDNNLNDEKYLRGYYTSIMLEDLQLEKILTKGVAETHIHRNAGINFSIAWNQLMNLSIGTEEVYKNKFLVNSVDDKEEIKIVVAAVAITRLLLTHFLECPRKNFNTYMNEYCKSEEDKFIFEIIDKISKGEMFNDGKTMFHELKKMWEYLTFKLDITLNKGEEDYVRLFLSSPKELNTSGENIFLFKALQYIKLKKKENKYDALFNNIFFQYIRIKNTVFQGKVQENTIKGLKSFQPFYKRSTKLLYYDKKEYWLLLINNQFQNKHLKKLEFRFAFDGTRRGLKDIIINFLEAYKEFLEQWKKTRNNQYIMERPPQIGLIFHMIKSLDEQWYEKCWQNYYELDHYKDKQKELFYNKNQYIYFNQIKILNNLRKEIPYLDKFLIGIDAASIEDNTEPWVFAPVYQNARNSEDGCIIYDNGQSMQTLGFTFHVGEDFRHILTGLRHVDEVIEHFQYHAGDRIGHGIVLGINPEYWCEQNQITMLPRGEYLDNLLWVWGLCKDKKGIEYLDISYLEQKIMQLAEEIFTCIDGITIYMLWKAYQQKFKEFTPDEKFNYFKQHNDENKSSESFKNNKIFCKYLPRNNPSLGQHWSYDALVYVQHCRCYAEKLLEPIQIQVHSSNINLYKYLQRLVLEKINNIGIVIETNPTSNLAIGDIKDLFHHYIFNLNDLDGSNKEQRAILSINSDDPSVFNTNVSNEIAYIFYALQKKGYSREEALNWINKIRNYGMKSSFLQDDDITVDNLENLINNVLVELKR